MLLFTVILNLTFVTDAGCPSVIDSFPVCIFVTDGRRDIRLSLKEMSWYVDVPFDNFGHRKLAKNAQKL